PLGLGTGSLAHWKWPGCEYGMVVEQSTNVADRSLAEVDRNPYKVCFNLQNGQITDIAARQLCARKRHCADFPLRPTQHQRGPYADATSKVGSCFTLNDTERAIKHLSAAASCSRRAMFSSEPAASFACGRNVTLSNWPAPFACSISTPEASSLYATTTMP